jgi:hypothetical protein
MLEHMVYKVVLNEERMGIQKRAMVVPLRDPEAIQVFIRCGTLGGSYTFDEIPESVSEPLSRVMSRALLAAQSENEFDPALQIPR